MREKSDIVRKVTYVLVGYYGYRGKSPNMGRCPNMVTWGGALFHTRRC